MGPDARLLFLSGLRKTAHVLAMVIATQTAAAQEPAPFQEIWKKSQIFEPRPSFDTTPVTVRVVNVVYRIPRNYLTHVEPAIPTLKLTWPGLHPRTEATQKCFGSILQSEREGCTSFDFRILGSRGPGPGGRALTNAEKFANSMRAFPDVKARRGPFGYDTYDTGPKEARSETYRRTDGDIYFYCLISGEGEGKRRGGCNDMFRLDDGNHVQFYFRLPHIEHVPEIEAAIRRLMTSFVTQGGSDDNDGVEPTNSKRN